MKGHIEVYQRRSTEHDNMKRLALFIVVALFQAGQFSVTGQNEFTVKSNKEEALFGHSFLNRTETKMEDCLQHCLAHCRCKSFQICDGNTCQLCSTNKYLMPNALQARSGCTYYDISMGSEENIKFSNQQCSAGCKMTVNCCLTSQPCLNGGACVPTQNKRKRYTCNCAPGYEGKRCETSTTRQCDSGYTGPDCETPITSCHGYAEGERKPGNYKVVNVYTNQSYDVYCNFQPTSSMAWTLVQSYQMSQAEGIAFPFKMNKPMTENTPSNISYRLSRQRMESIRQDSSYWGISCGSNSEPDHIVVSLNKLDIFTYQDRRCIEVVSVRVGNRTCSINGGSVCTVFLKQNDNEPIHSIYRHPNRKNDCSFQPNDKAYCAGQQGGKRDNYFGFSQCINPDHQCSASGNSTIQTWFGE